MSWSIGFVDGRDVGYGVPSLCEFPTCNEKIDRGLGYICGSDVGGGEEGCGLFFCGKHLYYASRVDGDEVLHSRQLCERCAYDFEIGPDRWEEFSKPFQRKPDVDEWVWWKLRDDSWSKWRDDNPEEVDELKKKYRTSKYATATISSYGFEID